MREVKISVVIPCLNAEKFISEAIESVLHQTLKEIEVIVVDAGSADRTIEILEMYQKRDARIRVLHSDKKSMGYQYNVGIHNARGQYVGFVESDDYIHAHMYENMYSLAEKEQLDFIKSDFDMFIETENGRVFLNYSVMSPKKEKLYGKVFNPEDYPEILYRDVNMWNGIFKRDFLLESEVVLNTTVGASFQDMGFVMKSFISAKKVMYIKVPSYYYRKDNENASIYNREKHLQFVMNEFNFIWEYMKQRTIQSPFRAIVFNRCFGMFCLYYDYIRFHGRYNETIQRNIDKYMQYIEKCFSELNYCEVCAEGLDYSLSLSLIKNILGFETVRKHIDHLERKVKKEFYEIVREHSFMVIFGAGEYGTALYAFLIKNNIKNVLCFCDNDRKKADKKIMNKICLLPERIKSQFPKEFEKILFIVANKIYYSDISKQLLEMGIKRENIIRSVGIPLHCAFELNMEEI